MGGVLEATVGMELHAPPARLPARCLSWGGGVCDRGRGYCRVVTHSCASLYRRFKCAFVSLVLLPVRLVASLADTSKLLLPPSVFFFYHAERFFFKHSY